jgi:hypothetical protein
MFNDGRKIDITPMRRVLVEKKTEVENLRGIFFDLINGCYAMSSPAYPNSIFFYKHAETLFEYCKIRQMFWSMLSITETHIRDNTREEYEFLTTKIIREFFHIKPHEHI